MRSLSLAAFLALPFVLYGLVVLWRHARQRRLAEELRARRIDHGPFTPGDLVGDGFEIRVRRAGKGFATEVRVACTGPTQTFHLQRGFFRAQPDWSRGRVPARTRQRVFAWSLELPGSLEAGPEQEQELLAWLERECLSTSFAARLAAARIRDVFLAPDGVSTRFRGIVQSTARLGATLELLRELGPRSAYRQPASAPASAPQSAPK